MNSMIESKQVSNFITDKQRSGYFHKFLLLAFQRLHGCGGVNISYIDVRHKYCSRIFCIINKFSK